MSDWYVMVEGMHSTGAWYDRWTYLEQRYPRVHAQSARLGQVAGTWVSGQSVVLINDTLDTIEARCALAHEIAHIDRYDSPQPPGRFSQRQERDADQLIPAAGLVMMATETVVVYEVAGRVDVTPRITHARLANLEQSLLAFNQSAIWPGNQRAR